MSEEKQLEQEESLDRCYEEVFTGRVGEIVLRDLMYRTGYENSCFKPTDRETTFELGTRSVFIYIKKRLDDANNRKTSKQRQENYNES